jgi:hypothetical protein
MAKSPTSHIVSKLQTQQEQQEQQPTTAMPKKHYFFGNLPLLMQHSGHHHHDDTDIMSRGTLLSDQPDDYCSEYDGEEEEEDAAVAATPSNSDTYLSQKWNAMEKRYSDRNRRFQRISDQTPNAELLSLLWERERAVRTLERECLLLRHGYSNNNNNNGNGQKSLFDIGENNDVDGSGSESDDSTENEIGQQEEDGDDDVDDELFYDAMTHALPESPAVTTPRPSSLMRRLPFHRAAVLEFKTTVPTSINVVFDCLFYVSAFEIIDIVMRWIAQKISKAWVVKDDAMAFFPLFMWLLCSLVILWHSGYLFWWSSQEVYSCLKFDLHNQLKLQRPSLCLRAMRYIREREILCMTVYMVGYIICYTSVMMLNELLYNSIFDTQSNATVLFYDVLTLTTSLWVLKTSGFFPWKKF